MCVVSNSGHSLSSFTTVEGKCTDEEVKIKRKGWEMKLGTCLRVFWRLSYRRWIEGVEKPSVVESYTMQILSSIVTVF